MSKLEGLLKNKAIIYEIIEKTKKRNKNGKKENQKIGELVTDIDIDINIAKLLAKNKIDKSEKLIINNYLKNEINNCYSLDKDFYKSFILTLNLYIYGFENSLPFFRNPLNIIKKDIMIKLTLYKNLILSFSDKDIIKEDINNIKELIIDNIKNDDIEDDYKENMTTLSYSSSFGLKMEKLEDQNGILDIVNHDLEKKCIQLEKELELLKNKLDIQEKNIKKQNDIENENIHLKNKIRLLERKNKLIDFEKNIKNY